MSKPSNQVDLIGISASNVVSSLTVIDEVAQRLLDAAPSLPIIKVLEAFKTLRDEHDKIDVERKKVNAKIEKLSRETIPELLRDLGTSNFKADELGYRFTLSNRVSASMADKERGMGWLRDHGYGDVIQETVNSSTLSSLAKELAEKNVELPPDLFKTSVLTYTTIAKV